MLLFLVRKSDTTGGEAAGQEGQAHPRDAAAAARTAAERAKSSASYSERF